MYFVAYSYYNIQTNRSVTILDYSDRNAFRYLSNSFEMQSHHSAICNSGLLFENITLSFNFFQTDLIQSGSCFL